MAPDAKLCSSCSERCFGSPTWLATISNRNFGSRAWTCTFCLVKTNKTPQGGECAVKVLLSPAALLCAGFFQPGWRCFFLSPSCLKSATIRSLFSLVLGLFFFPSNYLIIYLFVTCSLPHPYYFCHFSAQLKEPSCG